MYICLFQTRGPYIKKVINNYINNYIINNYV